jgi:hypothetical protein
VATVASEVYMLGGLLFELLSAGHVPFFWLLRDVTLLIDRRRSSAPVPIPFVPGPGPAGLLGKSVLEAAAMDGVAIPWTVRTQSLAALVAAQALVARCCKENPSVRVHMGALSRALEVLHAAEMVDAGRLPQAPMVSSAGVCYGVCYALQ